MWFGLVVLCSLKRGKKSSLTQFESTHHSLNQLNKVFAFMWIDSHLFESIHIYWIDSCMHRVFSILNRLTKLSDLSWFDLYEVLIVSIFILGTLESTQIWFESYHPSYFFGLSFCCLNRFKHLVNQFNLLHLCKNWVFLPLTIYTLLLFSKFIESFASILSKSQKLIAYTFFKIKHFFS